MNHESRQIRNATVIANRLKNPQRRHNIAKMKKGATGTKLYWRAQQTTRIFQFHRTNTKESQNNDVVIQSLIISLLHTNQHHPFYQFKK